MTDKSAQRYPIELTKEEFTFVRRGVSKLFEQAVLLDWREDYRVGNLVTQKLLNAQNKKQEIGTFEMPKPADKDILKTLAFLEEQAEMFHAMGNDDMLKRIRRQETLIRRLAREAGYDFDA